MEKDLVSLDGILSHDNGSDQWDGSAIGGEFGDGNRPGGAMIIEEANVNYLRIQDTGDPRDYGYGDPGSNRKVYLGHDLTTDGYSDTIMDDGGNFELSRSRSQRWPSGCFAPERPAG